jgi:hypothetical protein
LGAPKLIIPKPPHRFFDKVLDNDVDKLYQYLYSKAEDLVAGSIGDIPLETLSKFSIYNGAPTQLGSYYNIFTWDCLEINSLKNALSETIQEACIYYGIDYEKENYFINGWFNLDFKTQGEASEVSPLKHPEHYHDHAGGTGAPVFHGYYCVNAEPSSTFYKIQGSSTVFENINKNNRLIVSETGHPHGRDDWFEDKPRITIAYDIATEHSLKNGVKL